MSKDSNKEKAYRCNNLTGIKTYFSDNEEIEIIKWITEMRKLFKPISTRSLIFFANAIKPDFKNKSKIKLGL